MSISKKHHVTYTLGLFIGLTVVALIVVYVFRSPAGTGRSLVISPSRVDYSTAKSSEVSVNNSRKAGGQTDSTLQTSVSTNEVSIQITRASVDNTHKALQVGTLVSGATSGVCTLIASKAGETDLVLTDQVTQSLDSYTCAVFNISFSQFPSPGSWHLSVQLSTGAQSVANQWPYPVVVPTYQ